MATLVQNGIAVGGSSALVLVFHLFFDVYLSDNTRRLSKQSRRLCSSGSHTS